jgi:predicted ATPase
MITRLYANNFRCLVAFETHFDSFGILCGPNGAGKSSVFDAIRIIQGLGTGDAVLGGDNERDVKALEFTDWLESTIQEFEIDLTASGHAFNYLLHIEQASSDLAPRIIKERATCDKRELFSRDLEGVVFRKATGSQSGFPLDWRQAALGAIQSAGDRREIQELQDAFADLLVLRPLPNLMESESRGEGARPALDLRNLTSWYRTLYQEQEWADHVRESLQTVWPDFRAFRLVDVGIQAKALQLRFDATNGRSTTTLFFNQLSDGEKMLIALYMVRSALATGATHAVLIDEPDNFVGLPELQPWVLNLMELLDDEHQAILVSHHPELLNAANEEYGRYLWRDNHTAPTRIGPLKLPEGMTAGEAIARGWINA